MEAAWWLERMMEALPFWLGCRAQVGPGLWLELPGWPRERGLLFRALAPDESALWTFRDEAARRGAWDERRARRACWGGREAEASRSHRPVPHRR